MLAGSELVLRCPVSQGVPAPEVTWYHEMNEASRGELRPDHSLVIRNLAKEDAGLYTCRASNSEGSHNIRVRQQ